MNKDKKNTSSRFITYEHLDKVGEIAVYYGFAPAKSPTITKVDVEMARSIMDNRDNDDKMNTPIRIEEKVALLRTYQENNMQSLPQPVMLYFKDACKYDTGIDKQTNSHRYADLEILGTSGSIAEAILIQTTRSMLAEEGFRNTNVEVNSIGDKDSMSRFVRELTSYYRKKINDMSASCRQLFKEDPLLLLTSDLPECRELNGHAPKSLDFLTEGSRRHLEELLEYFETLDIPYSINNTLLTNKKFCSETVFSINDASAEGGKILAMGARYNGLAKKLGMKRDIQGVGISILAKSKNASMRKSISKVKRPLASFVQLSPESKLLSLDIIERLRKVKIPMYLSLAKDRLGAQVGAVEKHHTPYIIVMGKKEAVEKNVIVRENDTHAQEIVSIDELPRYMKKKETEFWKS